MLEKMWRHKFVIKQSGDYASVFTSIGLHHVTWFSLDNTDLAIIRSGYGFFPIFIDIPQEVFAILKANFRGTAIQLRINFAVRYC